MANLVAKRVQNFKIQVTPELLFGRFLGALGPVLKGTWKAPIKETQETETHNVITLEIGFSKYEKPAVAYLRKSYATALKEEGVQHCLLDNYEHVRLEGNGQVVLFQLTKDERGDYVFKVSFAKRKQ